MAFVLRQGERVPDVRFVDERGEAIALQALLGAPLVLFFYPKDETPGCVAEACAFRDAYQSFVEAGATVVGVSSDSQESHARFKAHYGLPFRLLSDPDASARKAFGIPKTLGILPGRATFVIDGAGAVVYSFNSQFSPQQHISRALDAVARIAAPR